MVFAPATGTDRVRVALAKDLIADIVRFDQQLAANTATLTALLDEHGTRLREIDGIGPVLAARLLGRTGHAARFATEAGVRERQRHRPCSDRQRREQPPPSVTQRRPATQLRDPHRRDDPDPNARQRGPCLLRQEDRRGQNTSQRRTGT